ncbi:MAG TPA: extracellular solute-binding protein [Chloroflexota bacterium]|jgi:multiple sugar transport system substrate-binding protein
MRPLLNGVTSRRTILVGLVAAAVSPIVAACASAPPATPTAAPAAPAAPTPAATAAPVATKPAAGAKQVEIKYHYRTGDREDAWTVTRKEFMEKNPNIVLKWETYPAADYYDKISVLIAGDQLGDVIFGIPPTYHEWALSGLWKQVDPFIQSNKFDMSPYFEKGALSHLRVEGKLHGIPFKASPGTPGLYYNKDVLDKEGLDPAKLRDLNDLAEMGKKLTKSSGGQTTQWGLTYVGHDGSSLVNWTRYWGVEPVEPVFNATKALLDQPNQVESITYLWKLIHEHKVCPLPGPGAQAYDQLFIAGTNAMTQQGTWARGYATNIKDKFKMDVVKMPVGPSGKIGLAHYYDFMGINGKTKQPDESWTTLTTFCGYDHGVRIGLPGEGSWTPGGRQDVYDEVARKEPMLRPFAEIIKDSGPVYYTANYRTQKTVTTIKNSLDKIILNPSPPKAADFKEANEVLQGVLDEPK